MGEWQLRSHRVFWGAQCGAACLWLPMCEWLGHNRAMAKIISIVQVKGGAGRSTLSTNIAGELSKRGHVVLLDCDMPQGTSASWYAVRQELRGVELVERLVLDTAASHAELIAKAQEHAGADFIVIDCPPRIAEITRAALVLADLALVPVGASLPELWASSDVVALVDEARKVGPVDARVVWTRFRSNTKSARELSAMAAKELGLPIMVSALALRVAYSDAMGEGLTVAEVGDKAAKTELMELLAEIAMHMNT